MRDKKETIGTVLMCIGFFLLFGSFGAMDCNNIDLFTMVVESVIGLVCLGSGVYLTNFETEP